jgi:hypothetical protein
MGPDRFTYGERGPYTYWIRGVVDLRADQEAVQGTNVYWPAKNRNQTVPPTTCPYV